jgi:hypothetical protein
MPASSAYADALTARPSGAQLAEAVMPFTQGIKGHASVHEHATREQIARRVAALKGCPFIEEIPQPLWPRRTYLVPSDTLVAPDLRRLKLFGEDDLLGGVVPHAFLATKAISHPLASASAAAPGGWNPLLADLVQTAVLPGYTAFSRQDALLAGEKLLALGPVRVKPVGETGGRGQVVVHDASALAARLAVLDNAALLAQGVVLEHNLTQVETLSVGQVRVAGILASYSGTQHLTQDNTGAPAYGGSDLTVVRGDFHALLATLPPGTRRKAVDQALVYDAAVRSCYPGFFASRINYDVAQGLDAAGQWCSGVLEQSWRIGGATGAELAALEAFHADKSLQTVHARCVERYGPLRPVPPSATLYFQGEDPEVGLLTKYALIHRDGDTA